MPRGVDANPQDIDQFAGSLIRFNSDLKDEMRRIQAEFNALGDTWNDQQHERFAREFEQMSHVLDHFLQSSEHQIPQLKRKAEALRRYLGSK